MRAPLVLAMSAIVVGCAGAADEDATEQALSANASAAAAIHHDVSPPLSSLAPDQTATLAHVEKPLRPVPFAVGNDAEDPVMQATPGGAAAITEQLDFAGVGDGDYGFAPDAAPPDPNGAVGDTQYVQWVNESFAVFDKATGALLYGPTRGNTLWRGFGGGCETNNDGDPIVEFDKLAQRWILTQFSVSTTPYLQCVAVSTTSDAGGTYNRYAFQYNQFPDYPKLAVWPDAYYVTFNMFTSTFQGARVCAYDRTAMLDGKAATQVCFQLGSSYGGLLPSDLDGATLPPVGSPNYVLNFGANVLNLWKFHVDFTTPANSSLRGPTSIAVATFTPACRGGACIPQRGTSEKLDSLADRLMYRLGYRNFGTHESLVVNHTVQTRKKGQSGVRWYELRSPGTTPVVYQQGTYAPDSAYRWMGSVAMDKLGDIALGYSVSSSSMHPAIRYTVHAATDALGTMEAEASVFEGAGSQLRNLNRWGDYSAMAIDPGDDCTFFYTNQYLKSDGTFNWSTRIISFKLSACR